MEPFPEISAIHNCAKKANILPGRYFDNSITGIFIFDCTVGTNLPYEVWIGLEWKPAPVAKYEWSNGQPLGTVTVLLFF